MQYEGTVYRPPSEARSLIVQVTVGCAHNTCTFCTMYKDKKFKVRPLEDVLADFDEAAMLYGGHIRRIFLADGDALIVKTDRHPMADASLAGSMVCAINTTNE